MKRRHNTNRAPNQRAAPWTPDEDEKLKEMCQIGLCSDFWKIGLPNRAFGDMLDRRLTLREAGQLQLARPI